jgi:two-component system cell cycle sensor histidine kinase/response regulator CckA
MYTILFADDTDIVRELFCEALRRSGYRVLEAEDGAKALSVGGRHSGPIDLLITDIMMPHLSGPKLRCALGASHPETRVLFISGYAGDEVDFDGPFLQKPFTPDTLLARVADILQASEAPPAFASPASASPASSV